MKSLVSLICIWLFIFSRAFASPIPIDFELESFHTNDGIFVNFTNPEINVIREVRNVVNHRYVPAMLRVLSDHASSPKDALILGDAFGKDYQSGDHLKFIKEVVTALERAHRKVASRVYYAHPLICVNDRFHGWISLGSWFFHELDLGAASHKRTEAIHHVALSLLREAVRDILISPRNNQAPLSLSVMDVLAAFRSNKLKHMKASELTKSQNAYMLFAHLAADANGDADLWASPNIKEFAAREKSERWLR